MLKKFQNTPLSSDTPSSTDKPLTEVVENVIEPLFNFANSLQQTLVLVRHLANQESMISHKGPANLQSIENKLVDLINRIEKLERQDDTSTGLQSQPTSQPQTLPPTGSLLLAAINQLPEAKLRAHLKQAIPRIHDTTVGAVLVQRRNKYFSSTEELLHIKYMSENRLEQLTEYFAQPQVQTEVKPLLAEITASSASPFSSPVLEETPEVANTGFSSPMPKQTPGVTNTGTSSSSAAMVPLTKRLLDAINILPESSLREHLKQSIPRIHDTTIGAILAQRRKKDFSSIEELLNIKYMSENRLEQMSEYFTQPHIQAEVEPFLGRLTAPNTASLNASPSSPKHEKKPEVVANTALSSLEGMPPLTQFILDAINRLPEPKLREHFKLAVPRVHDTTVNAVLMQRRKKPFFSSKELLDIKYMSENRLEQLTKYFTQAHVQTEVEPFLSTTFSTKATAPSASSSPMREETFKVANTNTSPSADMSPSAQFLLDAINQLPEKNLREHFKLAIPRVHDTTVNAVLAQRRKKFFSSQEELIKIKYMSETRREQLEEYFTQPQVQAQIKPLISDVTMPSGAKSGSISSTGSTGSVSSFPQVKEEAPSPMTIHSGTKSGSSAALPPSTKFILDVVNQLSEKELRNLFKQAIPRIHDTTVGVVITQRQDKPFTSLQELLEVNYMSENRLEQLQEYLAQAEVQAEIKRSLADITVPASSTHFSSVKTEAPNSPPASAHTPLAKTDTRLLLAALNQLPEKELREHFKQAIPNIQKNAVNAILARRQKKPVSSAPELIAINGMDENRLVELAEYFARPQIQAQVEPFLFATKTSTSLAPSSPTTKFKASSTSRSPLLKALNQLSEQELRNHFKQAIPRLHNSTLDAIIARRQEKPLISEKELVNIKGMGESRLEQLAEYFERKVI